MGEFVKGDLNMAWNKNTHFHITSPTGPIGLIGLGRCMLPGPACIWPGWENKRPGAFY